jgi:hypothetical protein
VTNIEAAAVNKTSIDFNNVTPTPTPTPSP